LTNASIRDFVTRCPDTIAKQLATLDSLKNGDLLIAAETAKFDAFLTVDQGIEDQQNLTARKISIMILRARSSRLKQLLRLAPACLAGLASIQPGQIVRIDD
jgi:hypothetical protein